MRKVKGHKGALIAGCRVAARLGTWEYKASESGPSSFMVRASIRERDSFWLEYRPLYLELQIGSRMVKWAVASLRESKTRITIEAEGTWGNSLSVPKVSA